MDIKINGFINFGWSKRTHVAATTVAVNKNRQLSSTEKELLSQYSQMPDEIEAEKGYYNNAHFYFPNGKTKSYGKEPEKNNAFVKYQEHYKKAFRSDSKDEFLRELILYLIHREK